MSLLTPGTLFAGHRIEAVVGRGGMGVVYRARQLELDRIVAIKVIKPELLDDPLIRERFLQEARTAARIEHPNVIPLHYAGVEDGIAYIVMRHVDGDDVHRLIRHEGPLAVERAAHIAAQVGEALDAIHAAGYVHRDVKPANVLVARRDHVYLTDFGLAKQTITRAEATRTGQWVGTLDYAAPEQIRGGRIDARTDVYALGGVVHYMLTGRAPFPRDQDEAKLYAHLTAPPPAPSEARPELPDEFDQLVARAMAKDPADRYPSAGDVGRAAKQAAGGGASTVPERMVATGSAAPEGAITEPGMAEASTLTTPRSVWVTAVPASVRRRPARAIVAGACLLAAGAAAAAALALSGGHDNPRQAARGALPPAKGKPVLPRVGKTIPDVGERPNAIAAAAGDVWVVSFRRSRLTRIDGAASRTLPGGPVVGVGGSDIAAQGDDLWVANSRSRRIIELDARSGRVVRRMRLAETPRGLAAGPRDLWIAAISPRRRTTDSIIRYDHALRRRRATVHVSKGVQTLVADRDGLWFGELHAPRIRRIDRRTGRVTTLVRLPEPAYDLSTGDGYLWAALERSGTVERIDPRTGAEVAIPAGQVPKQLVAAGRWVFVALNGDHRVGVIDPHSSVAARPALPVGLNPFAISAAAGHVWVTGQGADTVTRIDY